MEQARFVIVGTVGGNEITISRAQKVNERGLPLETAANTLKAVTADAQAWIRKQSK